MYTQIRKQEYIKYSAKIKKVGARTNCLYMYIARGKRNAKNIT